TARNLDVRHRQGRIPGVHQRDCLRRAADAHLLVPETQTRRRQAHDLGGEKRGDRHKEEETYTSAKNESMGIMHSKQRAGEYSVAPGGLNSTLHSRSL